MKIGICDDEFACVQRIAARVRQHCGTENIPAQLRYFTDFKHYTAQNMHDLDIVFLVIRMPPINGNK